MQTMSASPLGCCFKSCFCFCLTNEYTKVQFRQYELLIQTIGAFTKSSKYKKILKKDLNMFIIFFLVKYVFRGNFYEMHKNINSLRKKVSFLPQNCSLQIWWNLWSLVKKPWHKQWVKADVSTEKVIPMDFCKMLSSNNI